MRKTKNTSLDFVVMSTSTLASEVERRLEDAFHVRVALSDLDEGRRMAVVGSLLLSYDPSWRMEGLPYLVGVAKAAGSESDEDGEGRRRLWTDKDVLKQLKRY